MVFHSILADKLLTYELDKLAKRWIESQDHQGQKVVMSSAKSQWQMFNGEVPQGWILALIVFDLFIDNLGHGESESLSMI